MQENPPPVIDPTTNVLSLVSAAGRRMDDLRAAEQRRMDDVMDLRDKLRKAEARRVDDLLDMTSRHAAELREAESKRLDAIRTTDTAAMAMATERAAAQATVLARQLTDSQEAFRILVQQTAEGLRKLLDVHTDEANKRFADLEATKYTSLGRSGLSTPLLIAIALGAGGLIGFFVQMLFKVVGHLTP